MFKSRLLKALQLVVLTILFVNITFGTALAQQGNSPHPADPSQPSGIEKTSEVQPAPKGQLNGQNATPQSSQAQEAATPASASSRPQDPYENYYDAMKKFNQEVYGEEG